MAKQFLTLKNRVTSTIVVCLLAGLGTAATQPPAKVGITPAQASADPPAGTPQSWADDAVHNEIQVVESADKLPLRYRQRKVGAKGDTTREIIVSREGNVARLVERDGQPITAAENAEERTRLTEDINSPDDFLKRHSRDTQVHENVLKLINLMPQAMLYSFTPGQPQQKGAEGLQVVIDFHPNPAFHPPSMYAEALTGLEGRVWIDARTHHLIRIEARVLRPVNWGFGILAKIYPGGTLEFEQTRVDGDHWVYSHLDEHLTARLLMIKNYPENNVITSWDFRPMPSLLSYQDGIRLLLAMPVAVR
jgi:hypothetical protein